MPTITLTLPVAGTDMDAGPIATNFSDLQILLNGGLDADNLDDAAVTAAKLSLPYIAYVPVWSSSGTQPAIGNGTISGRYVQVGKLVHVRGDLALGGTSSGGTGTYFISLPVAANTSGSSQLGAIRILDSSTGNQGTGVLARLISSTTFDMVYPATLHGSSSVVAASAPWAWAPSDSISWNFTYEAA